MRKEEHRQRRHHLHARILVSDPEYLLRHLLVLFTWTMFHVSFAMAAPYVRKCDVRKRGASRSPARSGPGSPRVFDIENFMKKLRIECKIIRLSVQLYTPTAAA